MISEFRLIDTGMKSPANKPGPPEKGTTYGMNSSGGSSVYEVLDVEVSDMLNDRGLSGPALMPLRSRTARSRPDK
jgi:hypothetical protein